MAVTLGTTGRGWYELFVLCIRELNDRI